MEAFCGTKEYFVGTFSVVAGSMCCPYAGCPLFSEPQVLSLFFSYM
jgi:hypothetical protein